MINGVKYCLLACSIIFLFSCEKYQTERSKFNPPEWVKGNWETGNGSFYIIQRGEFVDSELSPENLINGTIEFLEDRNGKNFTLTFKDQRIYRFQKSSSSNLINVEFQNLQNGSSRDLTVLTKTF